MNEKRFGYGEIDLFEWVENNGEMISTKECCELLNNQEATIKSLKNEKEELGISIKLFEDDIATKDKKIDEQQATIERLKRRLDYEKRMHNRWKDDCLTILEGQYSNNYIKEFHKLQKEWLG